MKLLIAFLLTASSHVAWSQESQPPPQLPPDSTRVLGWKHSMATGLNLSQVSFKDWVGGGENALAYALWLNGTSTLEMESSEWGHTYKLAFGQTRLSSQGLRKTDDEIYVQSLLIYKLGILVNPYVSASLRTQFAKGFLYHDTSETEVSKFFDPAYLTQSAGLAWKPLPEFTTRLGAGVREIITSEFPAYADDPTTPEIEKTKVEGGLESVSDARIILAENVSLTSHLELFAPFKSLDRIVVRSDNLVTAKVSKYVSMNFNVQLINDVNISPLTQVKETLALGISYTLL